MAVVRWKAAGITLNPELGTVITKLDQTPSRRSWNSAPTHSLLASVTEAARAHEEAVGAVAAELRVQTAVVTRQLREIDEALRDLTGRPRATP